MGWGDELLAAGHAQALYDLNPDAGPIVVEDCYTNPRWSVLWQGNPVMATREMAEKRRGLRRIRNSVGCRPYLNYPFTHDTGFTYNHTWRARDYKAHIFLTDDERAMAAAVRDKHGPFVFIEPAIKPMQTVNKGWGFDRYAAVVREMLPTVTFLRSEHDEPTPLPGAIAVVSRNFREAMALLEVASCYLGPEGGLHHAARVVGCPAVVVFGGCIDPDVMAYPEQTNLIDTGPGSPCCRFHPCAHCTAAMARITVEEVVAAVSNRLKSAAGVAMLS